MFFCYFRPVEILSLKNVDLVKPGKIANYHSINLFPEGKGQVSKTGLSDITILLDSPEVPWLGKAIRGAAPEGGLFQLTYPELNKHFHAAVKRCKLSGISLVLYQFRHGGPSHDLLHRNRSRGEVKD
jgi:hypothetical protein